MLTPSWIRYLLGARETSVYTLLNRFGGAFGGGFLNAKSSESVAPFFVQGPVGERGHGSQLDEACRGAVS